MKAKELVSLNRAELESKVHDLKEELFNLRFQLATGQLQNTMVIKGVKHDIARCMTALRQLEQKDAQG
jgi:large subunit ribosomal protein L29